jgi:beta-barrel assembly-enhancing protease
MRALVLVAALAVGLAARGATPDEELSDAEEVRIGKLLAADWEEQEGMRPSPQNQKIDEYLQKVGDKVAAHAQRKLPYEFHFDPNPMFRSAVGFPGGQVYVGSGILAYMDTEDQLAMVLGHEIEHIALNQCRERLIHELAEKKIAARDVKAMKVDPFTLGYGHDKEFAADREGVKLAMEAGYSAQGAIRLLQTYILLGEQMPNASNEAKSNLEARVAQIREVAAASHVPPPAKETPLGLPQ